jgi:hypothetical protein
LDKFYRKTGPAEHRNRQENHEKYQLSLPVTPCYRASMSGVLGLDLAYIEQAVRIMCTLAAATARLIQALHGG